MSSNLTSEFVDGSHLSRYATLSDAFAAFKHEPVVFKEIYDEFALSVARTPDLLHHRQHIEQNKLGFGDRAFHWLWKLLVDAMPKEFNFLEVGVYKGQVLSLVGMLAVKENKRARIFGVTPLDSTGDKFSRYETLEYAEIIDSLQAWSGIPIRCRAQLIQGYSTDPSVKRRCRGSAPFNIIYIDGGHDYNVVANDIITYSEMIADDGYFVMDDASTELNMPESIWRGHVDVGRAIRELLQPDQRFVERLAIGHLRVWQKKCVSASDIIASV